MWRRLSPIPGRIRLRGILGEILQPDPHGNGKALERIPDLLRQNPRDPPGDANGSRIFQYADPLISLNDVKAVHKLAGRNGIPDALV